MTKPHQYHRRGSSRSIRKHIDPEREENLRLAKIEIEDQVQRILKLTKTINSGSKERRLKKRTELLTLADDFQKQYDSLYSLYQELRDEIKNNFISVDGHDGPSSSSSSSSSHSSSSDLDTEAFSSPLMVSYGSSGNSTFSENKTQGSRISDTEETILKDKLTSSSQVKKAVTLASDEAMPKPEESKVVLRIQGEENSMGLEAQVAGLKLQVSTLSMQKNKLQEKLKSKTDEATQMKSKISGLENQVMEIQTASKGNESQLHELLRQSEDKEQQCLSRISDLLAQENDMQIKLDALKQQKFELEGRLSHETKQRVSQVTTLMEQFSTVNSQKAELESELRTISEDRADCLLQVEGLRNELKGAVEDNKSLRSEIQSLSRKKRDLEEQLKKLNDESVQSNAEKEALHERISALQTSVSEKEQEVSAEREKLNACQNAMTQKIDTLTDEAADLKNKLDKRQLELKEVQTEKQQLEMELEKRNAELANRVAHQEKTMNDLEDVIRKLKEENRGAKTSLSQTCKSNFQFLERKMEEMAEEFRKQFEDRYRILSRRISVAEQLQVEFKEWYLKKKEVQEQETKDLKERTDATENELKNMKDVALTANTVVTSLNNVALKFEESTANFLNRISKSSCELKFAKHWAMRKNKALVHAKEDLDCLVLQLHDKEGETIGMREKLWKLENKVRELEKVIEEKEDGMLVMIEEKREAIRQLCVWIDYHRGRSDYFKKILSNKMNPAGLKRAR